MEPIFLHRSYRGVILNKHALFGFGQNVSPWRELDIWFITMYLVIIKVCCFGVDFKGSESNSEDVVPILWYLMMNRAPICEMELLSVKVEVNMNHRMVPYSFEDNNAFL